MSARILLVEDDASLGETLSERLVGEGYDVSWQTDACGARDARQRFQPDLIILDVRLPDDSGFELAQEIKTTGEPVPFIFLTAQAGAPERLRGFELGAEEFIPKPFHLKELLIRMEHVLQTHPPAGKLAQLKWNGYTIDFDRYVILAPDNNETSIAPRDMRLLQMLVGNSNRTVSRDEILNRLWGESNFPSNRTIDNAIVRLRQALGPQGGTAIKSIRGVGYRWNGEAP